MRNRAGRDGAAPRWSTSRGTRTWPWSVEWVTGRCLEGLLTGSAAAVQGSDRLLVYTPHTWFCLFNCMGREFSIERGNPCSLNPSLTEYAPTQILSVTAKMILHVCAAGPHISSISLLMTVAAFLTSFREKNEGLLSHAPPGHMVNRLVTVPWVTTGKNLGAAILPGQSPGLIRRLIKQAGWLRW